jgi:hypothetical protein
MTNLGPYERIEDDICIVSCGICGRAIVGIDQGLASCPWCERDTLRDRLAKLGSSLDGECPTMPFPSCECCNAAARARELIASNESP